MSTKTRIILKAIELFNRDGFAYVKLKQISDELGMSLGNFTYHFPKKDDLTIAVYLYLMQELDSIYETIEIRPDLGHIDAQLHFFHKVQSQFAFFYKDTLEIFHSYPSIIERHRNHVDDQIQKIRHAFLLNVQAGNFKNTLSDNDLLLLGEIIWQLLIFYATKNAVRGIDNNPERLAQTIWLVLRPYLTAQGVEKFKQLGYTF